MNQEPDTGVLDADTEEWQLPESDGDESAGAETQELAQADTGDGDERAPAEFPGAIATERVQPRHARPRDLRRLATTALSVALVVAVGLALYFWLQLDSARGGDGAPNASGLSSQLAQANARLAETEEELREAQVRVVDAETEARELQNRLDEAIAAAREADDELADAADELKAVSDSLAAARSASEAMASAVLGSVDPLDACVRAAAQVAANVDEIGRGRLTTQAGDAAATCAAAQEFLASAVSQARGVLAD